MSEKCRAITKEKRLDYLEKRARNYLEGLPDVEGDVALLHRGTRDAWKTTMAYEVVMQRGNQVVGEMGYRSGLSILPGFDSESNCGVCAEFTEIGENEAPEKAKDRILELLAAKDCITC